MSIHINQQVIYFPKKAVMRAVKKFETPFFIYEESRLRENCRRFRKAFQKYFGGPPGFQPLFAVKANNNPAILKIIKDEGFWFDCSSESEAWIVREIGGKGMYTGNYTPTDTLKFAKKCGLILNLDDIGNVDSLSKIGVPEVLSFRINPGIGNGAMESVVTAGPDAKFGVPFEKAVEAYRLAKACGVKKFGIHMMTGSNILDEKYFAKIVERLFEIVARVRDEADTTIEFMNIGGGFGVPYKPEEKSLNIELVAKSVREVFDRSCKKFGLKEPQLMAEPGRYVTADMGWLVGKVVVIKDGYKKFIGIDASSNDMPRPSIYGAYHYVTCLIGSPHSEVAKPHSSLVRARAVPSQTSDGGNSSDNEFEKVSIVGSICENNDQFAKDRKLPACEVGDIIVIHNCGGHAYAMGHNYNGKLRHAEYLIKENGDLKMIRRAETFKDLYRTVKNLRIGRTGRPVCGPVREFKAY